MRAWAWAGCLLAAMTAIMASPARAVPPPDAVAILYNASVPESQQLAQRYAAARAIPTRNLVGLKLPVAATISRDQYQQSLAKPLRAEFDQRGWWQRGRDSTGHVMPSRNSIRVLVTMRGVPLRIQPLPPPAVTTPVKPGPSNKKPATPAVAPMERDEAAVDSELAMVGVEGMPAAGPLANKFYQSNKSIMAADLPFLLLTARIDAASYATCDRMIDDALATEATGLWGMAYVDIAHKYPMGDQWLEAVAASNSRAGIPTVVDNFNETFPLNYPMRDAACYFGWYDGDVSGPFLNPAFKFRRGAVAMHLHSFSAQQLDRTDKNWCAPLLDRGAAVTVGNVYEPYLHLTHDFGLLQQRLLAGDCWVEACWKAMPVASWQGVVLGDPLYQPFKHLDGRGRRRPADDDYRALRAAAERWPGASAERVQQLDQAAQRTSSGVIAEAAGLDLLRQGLTEEAAQRFRTARSLFVASEDQLRQDCHLIAIARNARQNDVALRVLREAQARYGPIPAAEALAAWGKILEPPPAAPAGSKKTAPPPNKPPAAKAGVPQPAESALPPVSP